MSTTALQPAEQPPTGAAGAPCDEALARTPARRSSVAVLGWVALSLPVVALVLLRLPSLFEPRWYGDEGVFAAVASHLLHGQVLYVDTWDNKPPMIFLTYAAVQFGFGAGMFPLHAAATAAALATLIVVMALAARLYGRTRSFVAGAVFAAIIGTPLIEADLALTEIFMILPISAAMLVALTALDRPPPPQAKALGQLKAYLAAGVLLGIAANYKQIAVFDAAALALIIWRAPGRPVLSVALLGSGFALPHVAALAAFTATGALGDYWFAVIGSLRSYSGGSGQFVISGHSINYLPALIAIAFAVLVTDRTRAAAALPVAWLGFAFAGALSSPFAFPHYLIQVAPPFALVVASLQLPKRSAAAMAPIIVAALTVALGWYSFADVIRDRTQTDPVWYYRGFVHRVRGDLTARQYDDRYEAADIRDIVAAINADGGGNSLFQWADMPWLYAAGGFSSPSRYSTAWLGTWVPNARDEIARDVTAHPPDYLVIAESAPDLPPLQDLADRLYTPIAQQGDWRLYRRTGLRTAQP